MRYWVRGWIFNRISAAVHWWLSRHHYDPPRCTCRDDG